MRYRGLDVEGSAVVHGLPGGPVGVAEQPRQGPLEVPFRVGHQTHPEVKTDVGQQGSDEGCGRKSITCVKNPCVCACVFTSVYDKTMGAQTRVVSEYLALSDWTPRPRLLPGTRT